MKGPPTIGWSWGAALAAGELLVSSAAATAMASASLIVRSTSPV
jgi:hypothetical protein